MHKIFTTIGSKTILKQLIKEHPERHLYLYQGNQDYQIVDPNSSNSIFKIPIEYTVENKYGNINWTHDKNTTTFIVSDDEKKLLANDFSKYMNHLPNGMQGILFLFKSDNENQITLTSFWDDLSEFHKWIQSNDANFFTKYKADPTSNYYTIDYQPV